MKKKMPICKTHEREMYISQYSCDFYCPLCAEEVWKKIEKEIEK